MENEFTDFLNQNWNEKFKAGVTSSPLHLNSNGTATNNSSLNHVALQQYHQQSLRGTTSSSTSSSSSTNYENIRLAFMQHRHQTQVAAAAVAAVAQAQHASITNASIPIQRNPSTTAACPKLIDIHCIKGNNAALPFDCQSIIHYFNSSLIYLIFFF